MNPAEHTGEVRFWYSGKTAPETELAGVAEAISVRNEIMFCQDGERRSGPYADVIEAIEKGMQALQRNAYPLVADSADLRMSQFASALMESTETQAQQVQVLTQLGAFRFRKADSAEDRKQKLSSALNDLASGEPGCAEKLWQVWRPEPKSYLDSLISRPSDLGRIVARRMRLGRDNSLKVVAHRFASVDAGTLQPFIDSQAVAYHEAGERTIYLVGGVGEHLGGGSTEETGEEFTHLHILLLHELVEEILEETVPDSLAAHVVATSVARCLGGTGLQAAVESYRLELKKLAVDGDLMAIEAELEGEPGVNESDDEVGQFWADCIVTHDELRSEAFEQRSTDEQNLILRAMFGDDWNEEDEAAVEDTELASA